MVINEPVRIKQNENGDAEMNVKTLQSLNLTDQKSEFKSRD